MKGQEASAGRCSRSLREANPRIGVSAKRSCESEPGESGGCSLRTSCTASASATPASGHGAAHGVQGAQHVVVPVGRSREVQPAPGRHLAVLLHLNSCRELGRRRLGLARSEVECVARGTHSVEAESRRPSPNVYIVSLSPVPDRIVIGRMTLGRRIRELRTTTGASLGEVSATAGISLSYLSELERGHRLPTLEVLDAVTGALGTTVAGIVQGLYPWDDIPKPASVVPVADARRRDG